MKPNYVPAAFAFAFFILVPSPSANAGVIIDWQASSGNTPDQISIPWTALDDATPEDPVLSGGLLTLSTSQNSENMWYIQTEPLLDTSLPFFIETRVRYVSGSTSDSARAPIVIALTTGINVGNALFIDDDQVFFNTGNLTAGTKVSVDTNDAFHTYRINYDGSSGLDLLYDGNLILTGSTFSSADFNGSLQRILWGEVSSLSGGVSEWSSFTHNAGVTAVPEPSSVTMYVVLFGCGVIGERFRRRKKSGRQQITKR